MPRVKDFVKRGCDYMLGVHDNEILEYSVDFTKNTLVMRTKSENGTKISYINITFEGFRTYFFENQIPRSIILDIEEININDFIVQNKDLLERQKCYGFPIDYSTNKELEKILIDNNYKCFVIFASLGLTGWVLAKKISYSLSE